MEKFSKCCGYITEKLDLEETLICGNCKKACRTRGNFEMDNVEDLLIEIRNLLQQILDTLV